MASVCSVAQASRLVGQLSAMSSGRMEPPPYDSFDYCSVFSVLSVAMVSVNPSTSLRTASAESGVIS
jgi:hypothetical protein